MPALQPVDASFFDSAPVTFVDSWDVTQSAADFWDDLVTRPLFWCRGLRLRWTSDAPLGVGSTRHVAVFGAVRANEHFFLWDEGQRHAFYITQANLPLARSFAECFEVEPTSPSTCRFTWKVALDPGVLGAPSLPITRLIFRSLFRDTSRHFGQG